MVDYSDLRKFAQRAASRDGQPFSSHIPVESSQIVAILDELDALRAKAQPVKRSDYPPVFEECWSAYPPRPGMSKQAAYKAWTARINAGATPTELLDGTRKYAAYIKAQRKDPEYTKMPATFYGPSDYYKADWSFKAAGQKGKHGPIGDQDFNSGVGPDGAF